MTAVAQRSRKGRGPKWFLAFCCIAGAFAAGRHLPDRTAPRPPVCRPSDPPAYLARHSGTRLLLVGNSLLFDRDWILPDVAVVNCARQGQTAAAALGTAAALPDMAPAIVLLGFGSVEALRAANAGRAVLPDGFARDMEALVAALRRRWPAAAILLMTVPNPPGTARTRAADARALNAVLGRLADADAAIRIVDINALPAMRAAGLYDGLHPSRAVYEELERVLTGLIRAGT
jgi:hypothetical protein